MRFGFVFFGRDLAQVGPIAQLAEEVGFDLVGLCDSPSLAFDPYVALALAATRTRRIRLGPGVTNPQTRHPLILANLAASLEHLAPGRSFLGLGTGNSGVRHAGAGPATLQGLADTVETARGLLQGRPVEVGGATLTVMGGGVRVPVVLAGSGPRMLRLAGRLADAVWINLGVTPDVVADGVRWVREGAESAGRDPATVEVWAFGIGACAPDRARALDEAKGGAVAIANYILRGDAEAKRVPPAVRARADELFRQFQYGEHLTPGRTTNYELADRLELTEFLLDRFAIAGTPDDCRRKLAPLAAAGIDGVCFSFSAAPDVAAYVRAFGEHVLPSV
jgi:5,10-methylenetetrahydromethanopterin reductase